MASYTFEEPFHLYLAKAFKAQPGWGSRDRKRYRRWSYTYFKHCPKLDLVSWPQELSEVSLIAALLSSAAIPADEKQELLPLVSETTAAELAAAELSPTDWPELSDGLSVDLYRRWFQQEPGVFARRLKIWNSQLPQPLNSQLEEHLHFAPGTSLQLAQETGYCFVQDLGSQLSVQHDCLPSTAELVVWDACCGAGGKSLQLSSRNRSLKLICSDVRSSILENLTRRFRFAKLPQPRTFTFNPLKDAESAWLGPDSVDRIILDVPCSGSGTWRRNPEEWHAFSADKLTALLPVQSQLMDKVASRLAPGGYMLYITCSVFRDENENQVNGFLARHAEFDCIEQSMLGGEKLGADYLFRAVLKKIN